MSNVSMMLSFSLTICLLVQFPLSVTAVETAVIEAKINSFTGNCQNRVKDCLSGSPKGQELYANEQFCDLINLNINGETTKACLVSFGGCSTSEFYQLKVLACTVSTLKAGQEQFCNGVNLNVNGHTVKINQMEDLDCGVSTLILSTLTVLFCFVANVLVKIRY